MTQGWSEFLDLISPAQSTKEKKIVKWTLSKVKAFIFAQTHVKTNGVAFLPQNSTTVQ